MMYCDVTAIALFQFYPKCLDNSPKIKFKNCYFKEIFFPLRNKLCELHCIWDSGGMLPRNKIVDSSSDIHCRPILETLDPPNKRHLLCMPNGA